MPALAGAALLQLRGLSKCYGRFRALSDVSLDVRAGEIVGLFGEDGAGKTTLFEAIMGLARVDGGAVVLNHKDITRLTVNRRAPLGLSYLSQEPSVFGGMTAAENIAAILEHCEADPGQRPERLDWLLRQFNLEHLRDTPAPRLSGGERRRCEIARAMAASPVAMLLDEPFAGIDPLTVVEITKALETLRSLGIGILVSDQNVEAMLAVIDRAYVLHAGRIIFDGSTEAMVSNEEVRRNYLGNENHAVSRPAMTSDITLPQTPERVAG